MSSTSTPERSSVSPGWIRSDPPEDDAPRPLRSLGECRIGERCRYTIVSDNELVEFFWHVTSAVERIERIYDGGTGTDRRVPALDGTAANAEDSTTAALVAHE